MSLVIARHDAFRYGMAKVFTVVNIMDPSHTLINKFRSSNDDKRSYCVHFACGHYIFVLDAVHPQEGQWFKPELQPNGDIHLIKNTDSRPQVSQEADDQDYGE